MGWKFHLKDGTSDSLFGLATSIPVPFPGRPRHSFLPVAQEAPSLTCS